MVTDKLRSYGAARRKLKSSIRHLSHKGLNNRAENSQLPLRKRERVMQKFRSSGDCQRFISVFSAVRNLFVPPASIDNAVSPHAYRLRAFAQWNSATRFQYLKIPSAAFAYPRSFDVTSPNTPHSFRTTDKWINTPSSEYAVREAETAFKVSLITDI
ncbi:transposase [Kozakia baliensis NRIC 0488]|nr:transposase [Kozakia baliensis NRIC 0488]